MLKGIAALPDPPERVARELDRLDEMGEERQLELVADFVERFDKPIEKMSAEECLIAISTLAALLREQTGDPWYSDVEDAALNLLDVEGKTGSKEAAVRSTISMLKKRGYKAPEEDEDGTHDI